MRKFGLIGYPLSHSFSQKYFREKFQRESITGCLYDNFPFPSLSSLPALIASEPLLEGLNVTIPYKEQVTAYLDARCEVVAETGACNCIAIREGNLYGFNTDSIGFEKSLEVKLLPSHAPALVLGTGGAALAVRFVLAKLKIGYIQVSRNPMAGSSMISYEQLTEEIVRNHRLIINASPVGMFPHTAQSPLLPYGGVTRHHYLYDLVYNPERTLFLRMGEERGALIQNGWEMLQIQAEESWNIWNRPVTLKAL